MATQIYGIDFGTTYSCIARVDEHGKPEVINNRDSRPTTPSVVHFETDKNIFAGQEAKNLAKSAPDRTISFVKRDIGHPQKYTLFNKEYGPEDIAAVILKKVVQDASETLGGEPITDVVITCPAYFGINEREAIKNAGKIADLNVRHILNEPTAAAFFYGVTKGEENQVVLVFDLGGGTFDITLIEIENGGVRVIWTAGDHNLGGKDWDERLVAHLAGAFKAQFPDEDPFSDLQTVQDLWLMAETIKIALSSRVSAAATVSHAGRHARVDVARDTFEGLTRDLLDRTVELTKTAIEQGMARLKTERGKQGKSGVAAVQKILLVGGSSRMPAVETALTSAIGLPLQMLEPDLAVAKGAALVGLKIMAGEMIREEVAAAQGKSAKDVDLESVADRVLEDAAEKVAAKTGGQFRIGARELLDYATGKIINVTSKGFGIVALDENRRKHVAYLIHNNTALPAELTEKGFGTMDDNQREVHIQVMEQSGEEESPEIANNTPIVDGVILGLPSGLPAGSPIHVTFRLNEDGTLAVDACEPSSGKDLHLEAKVREGVMSLEEVEQRREIMRAKAVI